MKFVFSILLAVSFFSCKQQTNSNSAADKIVVEVQVSRDLAYQKPSNFILRNEMDIEFRPINRIEYNSHGSLLSSKFSDRKVKWEFYSNNPVQVNYGFGKVCLLNPGDSIYINYDDRINIYSGKGSAKLNMWAQAAKIEEDLPTPTKSCFLIYSVEDYLQWSQYIDQKLVLQMEIFESYKDQVDSVSYDYLKAVLINAAESERTSAFIALQEYNADQKSSVLTSADFNAIWDSTQYKPWSRWLRSLSVYNGDMRSFHVFNRGEVQRRFNFDFNNDSLKSKEIRTQLYYSTARDRYKGLLRERLMAYIMDEQVIKETDIASVAMQSIFRDYYNQPGFQEYKEWVKKMEEKSRNK